MSKKSKRFLIGAGIAAVSAAGIYGGAYTVTKRLLEIALDREEPKIIAKSKKKLSGYEDTEKLIKTTESAAKELASCGCEKVEIYSHDGIRLVGHWYHNPNAQRVVVAMHGWRSSWLQDFGMISGFLHENGCSVLYAEQRAQNNSEGEHMTFGLLERYDCLEWIKWVNKQGSTTMPVYLAGLSMGATTVLMCAGLDIPENVRGIVADCGFTSPRAIWKHVAEENLRISFAVHDTLVERMCKQKINMGAQEYSTVEALQNCKVPVLFIHGTEDHFVPVAMTYENYKACNAPKQLLIVPGADHGISYLVEKERYEATIKDFWEETLNTYAQTGWSSN